MCARRLIRFLLAAGSVDTSFSRWYQTANRRKDAFRPVDRSPIGLQPLLSTNNRDIDDEPILELGFGFSTWNGKTASFSGTLGGFSRTLSNVVLLRVSEHGGIGIPLDGAAWRLLVEQAVEAFEPDSVIVTNHDFLDRQGGGTPEQLGGWLVYRRGSGVIVENPFP